MAATSLTADCRTETVREAQAAVTAVTGPAGKLHVDDGGAGGVPVVFLHSFAGNTGHWEQQLSHLRPTRRAVALDLRGHGKSDAPDSTSDYAIDAMAADVAAVVDSLHLDHVVLVGHSMGGSVALAYARAHPDKVSGLVLVGTPGKSPSAQARQVLAALEKDYDRTMQSYWDKLLTGAAPATLTRIESEMHQVPPDAGLAMIRATFAYDPTPAITAFRGPALIVDTEQPQGPGSLHDLAPTVPHRVVSGTSHWIQLDKPEEFNTLLDEFLTSVR